MGAREHGNAARRFRRVRLHLPRRHALWRRQRPVLWFAVALILVGLGYLMATGATDDIARSIVPIRVLG